MKTKSAGFIGGGRITQIFLHAFANKQATFQSVVISDSNPEVLKDLKARFPEIETTDSNARAAAQNIVFLALHPPVIMEVLETVKAQFGPETIFISLAPKLSLEKLQAKTGLTQLARMIPNATSYANKGFNPYCFSDSLTDTNRVILEEMFGLLGSSFLAKEPTLEMYALISAMLPTYFWYQWKELVQLGISFGLSKEESASAVQETLKAAVDLYFDSDLSPDEVMDLIPVKPLQEIEETVKNAMQEKLCGLFAKLKP